MSQVFLQIINMSISASYIALAVILLRLLLKKAPKWITVALWGIAALRLVCPFSVESVLSLIPSAQVVSPNIMTESVPSINTGIPFVNSTINPIISGSFPQGHYSANPLQILIPVFSMIWIIGMAVLTVYGVISYIKVKRKIGTAVLLRDNIYQSENVVSPFVLGIIKPKIYLPFNMNERDEEHIIAHERAHINRKDNVWKPLGFMLLTLHWFNPIMWIAYVLLCRDIELACDEKVIKELDHDARADYSEALLTCSVNRRMIAACPLAFGEVGVKARVKSVLNYKKPAFWIIVAAVVACITVSVCFLTNPKLDENNDINTSGEIYTDYKGVYVTVNSVDTGIYGKTAFNLVWHNETEKSVTYGETYRIERRNGNEWVDTSVDEHYFSTIGYLLKPDTRTNKYYSTEKFDVSKRGTYRLIVPFFVDEGDGYKEYHTWIRFEIGIIPTEDTLRAIYPHFFGLNDEDGLTVYVWQYSQSEYSCYLVSTAIDRLADQSLIFESGASISEMRAILNIYGIERDKVRLCPIVNPLSSYAYTIDEEYRQNLERIFWSEIVPTQSNTVLDTAIFDIDGDGIDEVCTMSAGPTSGAFSFVFSAREIGNEEIKYKSIIHSRVFNLSFAEDAQGTVKVKAVVPGEGKEYLLDISVTGEHVELTKNGIPIGDLLVKNVKNTEIVYHATIYSYFMDPAFVPDVVIEGNTAYTEMYGDKELLGTAERVTLNHSNFDSFIKDYPLAVEKVGAMRENNESAYEINPSQSVNGIEIYYVMKQKTGETLIVYGHYRNGEKENVIRFIFSIPPQQ